jgi:Tol biopolymer transport system component
MDWSADGRFALVAVGSSFSGTWDSLYVVQPDNPGAAPQLLLVRPGSGGDARISPDGRWLAYSEGAYASSHVVVIPFPPGWPAGTAPTARCQASATAAAYPRWTMNGRELVFARYDGTIVAVDAIADGGAFHVGPERELFRAPMRPQTAAFDVSPDGQRFYINALSGDDVSRLAIVTNWTAGLGKK